MQESLWSFKPASLKISSIFKNSDHPFSPEFRRSSQFLKEYQDAFMFNELEKGAGDAPADTMETA